MSGNNFCNRSFIFGEAPMDAMTKDLASYFVNISFSSCSEMVEICSKSVIFCGWIFGSIISLMVRPYNLESFSKTSRLGTVVPVSHFETAWIHLIFLQGHPAYNGGFSAIFANILRLYLCSWDRPSFLLFYHVYKLRAEPRWLRHLGRFARQMSKRASARASSTAARSDTWLCPLRIL